MMPVLRKLKKEKKKKKLRTVRQHFRMLEFRMSDSGPSQKPTAQGQDDNATLPYSELWSFQSTVSLVNILFKKNQLITFRFKNSTMINQVRQVYSFWCLCFLKGLLFSNTLYGTCLSLSDFCQIIRPRLQELNSFALPQQGLGYCQFYIPSNAEHEKSSASMYKSCVSPTRV